MPCKALGSRHPLCVDAKYRVLLQQELQQPTSSAKKPSSDATKMKTSSSKGFG